MKKYYRIQRFNAATAELIPPVTYTIGYVRCGRTGNMIVTFCNPDIPSRLRAHRQQLVILPAAFYRCVPDVSRHSVAGCIDVITEQLVDIGFILPRREVEADDTRVAVGS